MTRRFSSEGFVLGVGLVAVGLLAVLSRMGRADFLGELHTFWPLSLVLWGAVELLETLRARSGGVR